MKSNKILNKIAVIILSVLALVGIGFSASKVVKNFSNTKDINAKQAIILLFNGEKKE